MERLERSIESIDSKMDVGFETLGKRMAAYSHDSDEQITDLRLKAVEHDASIKSMNWWFTTGVFTVLGTIATIGGFVMAMHK